LLIFNAFGHDSNNWTHHIDASISASSIVPMVIFVFSQLLACPHRDSTEEENDIAPDLSIRRNVLELKCLGRVDQAARERRP
jgi:hypothetical protein